ncbi:hypothetical protein [Bacillus sp. Marseille-Q3570]|uniref:hypothetical protein n=1 Tax=Bacillus sp. Marseille-Q3570 TaxID=2963522 RepID=UPI0021B78967|nr:hypothetical protein [Bacillus sp. Marseille-Q3570]
MLKMPQTFDHNEWIILSTLVVTYLVIILIPKRFPVHITFLVLAASMVVAKGTNHILGAPPLDLYDFNDTGEFEVFDFLIWFTYPPFGYFFVYLYDRWNLKGLRIFFYIVSWTAFAVFFEWLTLKAHVFTYKGWRLEYSIPVYLIVLIGYILFFKFIKSYESKSEI